MATPPLAAPAGIGSSQQTLSEYAGPYVTSMLGKAEALSEQPYQVYGGPQTAGESGLQSKVFQGLGGLNFPSNLGQSFASPMRGQQYGQQPYPSHIPGTGGPMPPPGGFPGYNPYAGRQETTAAGAMDSGMDYRSGSQPMPDYLSGAGTARAAPTEADWNMHQQMALYARGTDMEKAKADFMSGGGKNLGGPEMGAYDAGGTPAFDFLKPQVMPQQGGVPQQGQMGIAGLQPPQASQQPSNIAQSYMNPYLQSVLNPQMDELRRQNEITNMQANSKLTGAGAFGGGRQAIMNAENNRNLMMEQNKTIGQGYANAYDKAMQQFNTEQGQAKTLADMMSQAGAQQRGIEQEGVTADYNEFLAQRDYPIKQTQYLQSMLQGLPISTVSNIPQAQTGSQQAVGGMTAIYQMLENLGVIPKKA